MDLTPEQVRVLGCLMEKAMTTPDQYPLTLNSLVLACNQSTSRDPIVDYSTDTVKAALDHLRMRHRYVRLELPGNGSRVEKYKHDVHNQLRLTKKEMAVMAVLLLRGPQTVNEIRTRTERMCTFTDSADLEATIDQLCDPTIDADLPPTSDSGALGGTVLSSLGELPSNYRRPWTGPLVVRLERVPGQKEPRVAQLVGGPVDLNSLSSSVGNSQSGSRSERLDSLESEVQALSEKLAAAISSIEALRSDLEEFRSQF